jgi:UDP-N-acetylglucosamine--N-acetylmuramyl-(pentapeptide) pyrophosphoryl-undecaprenol N-acetylglucosamine transferase
VFSTGGYSAAPVLSAAKALRIPYAIHEANSVPGRTHRMFGPHAAAFTSVFRCTPDFVPNVRVTRTGQPIRRELRQAVGRRQESNVPLVLVIGGSQGSQFLNETMPLASKRLSGAQVIHASGPTHFASTKPTVEGIAGYHLRPYLETEEILDAYLSAHVVVCRSGGTLAELALFGIPSVLVPLPTSADQHQLHNAEEFVNMQAASLVPQARPETSAEPLSAAVRDWLDHEDKRRFAATNLQEWSMPDATNRIVSILEGAVKA